MCSKARSGRFTLKKELVTIVQGAVWDTEMVWKDMENLVSNGIRSPDRLARHKSQYQLSYTGH
jgi:hypothetical protein